MPETTMRSLTTHELRVAALVARGLTNVEVGAELAVSPKTVESHLSSIYRKLELRSRTELALYIVRAGAMPDGEADRMRDRGFPDARGGCRAYGARMIKLASMVGSRWPWAGRWPHRSPRAHNAA